MMRTHGHRTPRNFDTSGVTLMDMIVAIALVGVVVIALYSGLHSCFRMIQLGRENLRATQILVEKMEAIRLYNWEQICTNNFVPTNFVESYYSTSGAASTTGILYHGTIITRDVSFTNRYSKNMKEIELHLHWTSAANLPRERSIRTYVSRYGLQNYVY